MTLPEADMAWSLFLPCRFYHGVLMSQERFPPRPSATVSNRAGRHQASVAAVVNRPNHLSQQP